MSSIKYTVILSALFILSLMITSCGILQTPATPSEDYVNTSVAETVNASSPTTGEPELTETVDAPTAEPTEAPVATEEPASAQLAVAFVSSDHNAYFWEEGMAAATQLTTTNDVQEAIVSPDAAKVALVRASDWSTYFIDLVNSDGSGLSNLVTSAQFAALPRPAETVASVPAHVSWRPDSQTIAMTTRITYEGPGTASGETLYLLDTNTTMMSGLLTIPSEWSWDYTYSPDGALIAISRPEGMDIYNADGSVAISNLVTYPFVNTASEYAWTPRPAWSSDSTALAVVIPPQDPWTPSPADSKVYQWNTSDSSASLTFATEMTYWPMKIASIAPDLSRILFLVREGAPEDNRYSLKSANLDGSDLQSVASGELYNLPDWSTDSLHFYFQSNADGAFIAQTGSAPSAYTAFNQVRNVKWVDAERFIGVSGPSGGWQLLLGSTSSPALVLFTSTTGTDPMQFTTNR